MWIMWIFGKKNSLKILENYEDDKGTSKQHGLTDVKYK